MSDDSITYVHPVFDSNEKPKKEKNKKKLSMKQIFIVPKKKKSNKK